jgi:hypothetical protein
MPHLAQALAIAVLVPYNQGSSDMKKLCLHVDKQEFRL